MKLVVISFFLFTASLVYAGQDTLVYRRNYFDLKINPLYFIFRGVDVTAECWPLRNFSASLTYSSYSDIGPYTRTSNRSFIPEVRYYPPLRIQAYHLFPYVGLYYRARRLHEIDENFSNTVEEDLTRFSSGGGFVFGMHFLFNNPSISVDVLSGIGRNYFTKTTINYPTAPSSGIIRTPKTEIDIRGGISIGFGMYGYEKKVKHDKKYQ